MKDTVLVPARQVEAILGLPRPVLYRLMKEKRVRYRVVTQVWHRQPQYRFDLEEVRADLERMRAEQD